MIYREELHHGKWCAVTYPDPDRAHPKMQHRATRDVQDSLHHLTLNQMREVFSPDGKFTHC
jgi:hypothetical protein